MTQALAPLIAAKAKEKQETEGRALGGKPTLSQKSTKGSIDTRAELAKLAGVSHPTYEAGVKVLEQGTLAPGGSPESRHWRNPDKCPWLNPAVPPYRAPRRTAGGN